MLSSGFVQKSMFWHVNIFMAQEDLLVYMFKLEKTSFMRHEIINCWSMTGLEEFGSIKIVIAKF